MVETQPLILSHYAERDCVSADIVDGEEQNVQKNWCAYIKHDQYHRYLMYIKPYGLQGLYWKRCYIKGLDTI